MHRKSANRGSVSWVKHASSRPLTDFCEVARGIRHLTILGRFLFNTIVNTVRLKLLDYPDHFSNKVLFKRAENLSFPNSAYEPENRKRRNYGETWKENLVNLIHCLGNGSEDLIHFYWKSHKSWPSFMVLMHSIISNFFGDELLCNWAVKLDRFF